MNLHPAQTTVPDPVTVTLDRVEWQALLDAVAVEKLSYGSVAWGAYQQLQRALSPAKPEGA